MRKPLILLLVIILLRKSNSQKCITFPSINSSYCLCEDRFQTDHIGGWELICFDHSQNVSLIVDYAINSKIKLECYSTISPYTPAMFSQMETKEIMKFEIKSCFLPNISFGEILKGYRVNSLKFESRKKIDAPTLEIFNGLEDLRLLSFQRNGFSYFPGDLFQNMTKLNTLRLNENALRSLEENIFADLKNLTILELGGNLIQTLPSKIFSELHSLTHLYLYQNKLVNLPEEIFQNLKLLRILDISNNVLEELPSHIFAHLISVEKIGMGGNRIKFLPNTLFRTTINLGELDFSKNAQLSIIPDSLLSSISKLENISMNSCNLSFIPDGVFSHNAKLKTVKLNNNLITELPENLLQNNSNLQIFLMDFNSLETLPAKLFLNQFELIQLGLSKNNLRTLHKEIFKTLVKLKMLNLAYNKFTELDKDIFGNMQALEILILNDNQLTMIRSFGMSTNLKKVNISRNRLQFMPDINWLIYLNIEEINLEHNNISSISIPILLSNRVSVKLGWNNISSIDIEDILISYREYQLLEQNPIENKLTVESSPRFYLVPNPIQCDCQLYPFISYVTKDDIASDQPPPAVFPQSNDLICFQPHNLLGTKITMVEIENLICDVSEDCPDPCHCYVTAENRNLITNCSDNQLSKFPSFAPWNTTVLDLSRNQITNLDALEMPIWSNLTELHLKHNLIKDLDDWNYRQKLRTLSLNYNKLSVLSQSFKNYTTMMTELHVSLGHNPWYCDCETTKLKAWLTENYRKIDDINHVYCQNEIQGNHSYINIIRIPDDILCPPDNWTHKRQLIIVSVIGVILALLLFITLIFYYRNRTTVMAYFYFHFNFVFFCLYNEDELDEDKLFDAFVSYGSNDRDVMMGLLTELETKEPCFKLCIHERDWMPGNLISLNIANSVQYSRRTILVLSRDFLESVWFQVEFQTAYHQMLEDKINRLIVIVKGELPPKESLDKNLQVLLSTKTYLIWEEKWFWEKLRYAMPHKRKPLTDVDHQVVLSSKTTNPDLLRSIEDKMSSFICLHDVKTDLTNPAKRSPSINDLPSRQTDSGVYSMDSISTEDIVSESGPI